jgi:hypothetical protein
MLKEEHKVRILENKMLRIFGPRRKGVTGFWRKLHSIEFPISICSPCIIRMRKSRGKDGRGM